MQMNGLADFGSEAIVEPAFPKIFMPGIDTLIRYVLWRVCYQVPDIVDQGRNYEVMRRLFGLREERGLQGVFELRNRFSEIRGLPFSGEEFENFV